MNGRKRPCLLWRSNVGYCVCEASKDSQRNERFVTKKYNMKNIPIIALLAVMVWGAGCRTKIVCDYYEVTELESSCIRYKTAGVADTVLARVNMQVIHVSTSRMDTLETNAIGASVSVQTAGTDDFVAGVIAGWTGTCSTYLAAGRYDMVFSYYGFNTLKLRNVALAPGEIKEIAVRLGATGAVAEVYEIDMEER